MTRLRLRVRLALQENRRLFLACGFRESERGAHPGYAEATYLVMEKALEKEGRTVGGWAGAEWI